MKYSKLLRTFIFLTSIVVLVAMTGGGSALADSTTKTLSTTYTVINLGTAKANVVVSYYKDNGTTWVASPESTSFQVDENGGSRQIRQYADSTMTSGKGSAVISSDQPLGSFVQLLARGQVPSSGAYGGITKGDSKFYLPLVSRRGVTATGTANSQIIVQNTDTKDLNVSIQLIPLPPATASYTKPVNGLKPGVSFYYDLDNEIDANIPAGWFGSAVVTATAVGGGDGLVGVVSNYFLGSNALMTYNGFPQTEVGSIWFVPLFTSKLSNLQSSVVTVQNISGASIPSGGITLNCIKDPASPAAEATLNIASDRIVENNTAYHFNAYSDSRFPAEWYGSCKVEAKNGATPVNVITIIQVRYIGASHNSSWALEGILSTKTDKKLYVPLIGKRLTNGFATVVTIQNLNEGADATVDLLYKPSANDCPGCSEVPVNGLTIPKGGSIMRSHRLLSGPNSEPTLPELWVGGLVVTSDQPIQAHIQITSMTPSGDPWMGFSGFTTP
jgi:hypothetical protein